MTDHELTRPEREGRGVNHDIHSRCAAYAAALTPDAHYEYEERLAILCDGHPLEEWMHDVAKLQISTRATTTPNMAHGGAPHPIA